MENIFYFLCEAVPFVFVYSVVDRCLNHKIKLEKLKRGFPIEPDKYEKRGRRFSEARYAEERLQ